VPASEVFPPTVEQTYAQIEACQQAMANDECPPSNPELCEECVGAAAPPPAGSTCPPQSGGEALFCLLENVLEVDANDVPCVPGEDCCSWTDVIDEDEPRSFDLGNEGFTYVDDPFRGTANPAYADGTPIKKWKRLVCRRPHGLA
jgi:hypothetical protein